MVAGRFKAATNDLRTLYTRRWGSGVRSSASEQRDHDETINIFEAGMPVRWWGIDLGAEGARA